MSSKSFGKATDVILVFPEKSPATEFEILSEITRSAGTSPLYPIIQFPNATSP